MGRGVEGVQVSALRGQVQHFLAREIPRGTSLPHDVLPKKGALDAF